MLACWNRAYEFRFNKIEHLQGHLVQLGGIDIFHIFFESNCTAGSASVDALLLLNPILVSNAIIACVRHNATFKFFSS